MIISVFHLGYVLSQQLDYRLLEDRSLASVYLGQPHWAGHLGGKKRKIYHIELSNSTDAKMSQVTGAEEGQQ